MTTTPVNNLVDTVKNLPRWGLPHVLESKDTQIATDNCEMALASAPSTPERTVPPIRRSFTAPIKSFRSDIPISEEEVEGAETLYAHSACKIVSFNTSNSLLRRHSSVSDGRIEFGEEPVGTLPWASTTERTIAAGMLGSLTELVIDIANSYVQGHYVFIGSSEQPSSTPGLPCIPSYRSRSVGAWMANQNLCSE